MKVSASGLPKAVYVVAAVYLAAHLPFLSPSLEDIDSINFALGLREFSPALHQPHPPGYPVFIALGQVMLALVSVAAPGLTQVRAEAFALALLSVAGGATAIVAAAHLFAALREGSGDRDRVAVWAAALLAATPVFWMTGLRPMSDAPGLAAALAAQALAVRGFSDRRRLVQAALLSAIAAGLRVQTLPMTLPLLALACFWQRRAGIGWLLSRPVAAFTAGVLLWAVPLLVVSGGLTAYLAALGSQAGEDFAWVNMLWVERTPRRLAFALYETLVLPWATIPLALAVGVAALAGAAVAIVRERRTLLLVTAGFVPYAMFHLLFHETIFVRYALPIAPAIALLAVLGVAVAGRYMPALAAALVAAGLIVAVPAGVAYGVETHPAFRAIEEAMLDARDRPPAAVYSHYGLWRPLQAEHGSLPVVEPRRQFEWMGPVEYWRGGGTDTVWFFADPRRTDLDLIDPQSRREVTRYRWAVGSRPELGGTRPAGADLYRVAPPGWFAGVGWSLTPETGGLANATQTGPDHRPIEAWVRRGRGSLHLVVGGRHLGDPGSPTAEFELAIDDVVRDRWTLSHEERNFLRFLDLPDGVGEGPDRLARLTIVARSSGGPSPPVAIRQFDIQPAADMVFGYGEGWHEAEYDVATGRRWRWTSDRSVIRVKGQPGAVQLTLRGESPLRYFDAAPTVRVTAGGRVVGQFEPAADFEWTVVVPAADLERGGGAIAVEVDRVYRPGAVEGTADERRLGLRLWESRVSPVLP